ncbi:iq-domain [Asimina triloba]
MGRHRRSWLGTIKNKFAKSPRKRVIAVQCNSKDDHVLTEAEAEKENPTASEVGGSSPERVLTEEDLAAIKIQASFRGHLVEYGPAIDADLLFKLRNEP